MSRKTSLKPLLSLTIFLQSCETKSGTERLGLRLLWHYMSTTLTVVEQEHIGMGHYGSLHHCMQSFKTYRSSTLLVHQRRVWATFCGIIACQFYTLLLSIILCTHLAQNTGKLTNLCCQAPDLWAYLWTFSWLCMYSWHWKKITLLVKEHTHTLPRSLTLIWWFTSASLLRRNSTIWSWPNQLAICNAVWPSCTCKGEQDRLEVMNYHTTHQLTQCNITLAWP